MLVKQPRARMGLTQGQLVQAVGETSSTINQWGNGQWRPQPYLWSRLLQTEQSLGTSEEGRDEEKDRP